MTIALPWIRAAGFLSLLAFAWIFHLLSQKGSPTRSEDFFYLQAEEDPVRIQQREAGRRLISLVPGESVAGACHYTLELSSDDPGRLLSSPRVGLMIGARDPAWIVSARLVSSSGSHDIAAPQRLEGARIVEFLRNAAASHPENGTRKSLMLEITTKSPAQLSVHAQRATDVSGAAVLRTEAPGGSGTGIEPCNVVGCYELPGVTDPFTKAELLACTWGLGPAGRKVVFGLLAVATVLWAGGLLLLRETGGYQAALGAGLLSMSILAVYAILSPPFQAPDEPDHFLTFAGVTGNKHLASDALKLANLSHFERIKFRPDQKFSSLDVGEPMEGSWAPHVGAPASDRSPLGRVVWSTLGILTARMESGPAVLTLRLSNAWCVGLCLTVALLSAAYASSGRVSPLPLALPALLVPSLAYFGVTISNYAYLVAGFLVQAVAFGLLWQELGKARKTPRFFTVTGSLAGFGTAVAACAADNGFISLIFWGIIIPVYVAISFNDTQCRSSLLLPGAFAGIVTIFCLAVAAAGPDGFSMAPRILEFARACAPVAWAGRISYTMMLLAAYFAAIGVMTAFLIGAGRFNRSAKLNLLGRAVYGAAVVALAVFVLLGAARSVPDIQTIAGRPPLGEYTKSVMHAFVDGLGPGSADAYVVNHFWGSLGWLDAVLPEWLRVFLRLGTGAGVLALLAVVLWRRSPSGSPALALTSLGAVAAVLLAIVLLYYSITVNVHGRYLIGLYVFVLVLATEGYRRVFALCPAGSLTKAGVVSSLCLLAAAVQSVSWTTILGRYLQ